MDQLADTFTFNPGVAIAGGVIFGIVTFVSARNYTRRTGAEPWSVPPLGWGAIGFVIGLFGLILYLIAQATTTRRRAKQGPFPGGPYGSPYGPPPGGPYGSPYGPYPQGYPPYGAAPPGYPPSGSGPPAYGDVVPPGPPPGWYPDPSGQHKERYWDGAAWSESVTDGGPGVDDRPADGGSGPIVPR